MNAPAYAELHCLSNFSFLRGASQPAELVQRAAELGYEALALTDECSVAGVVRAWEAAREHGLKLIIGSEFSSRTACGWCCWRPTAGLWSPVPAHHARPAPADQGRLPLARAISRTACPGAWRCGCRASAGGR
jgi:hypothetical protein